MQYDAFLTKKRYGYGTELLSDTFRDLKEELPSAPAQVIRFGTTDKVL